MLDAWECWQEEGSFLRRFRRLFWFIALLRESHQLETWEAVADEMSAYLDDIQIQKRLPTGAREQRQRDEVPAELRRR